MIKKKISTVVAIFLIMMQFFGIVTVFAEDVNDSRNINIHITMQEGVKPPELGEVEPSANVLSDAHFELRDAEGVIVDTIITDENGMVVFNDVPSGDYVLEAIKAPEGYELIEPSIFEIHSENWNGNDIYVVFQNKKSEEYVEPTIEKEKNIELTTNLNMDLLEVYVQEYRNNIYYAIAGYNGELPNSPIFPNKNDILMNLKNETDIGNYEIYPSIRNFAFSNKGIEGDLTIPENYEIGREAFKGNNITSLTIPEVTSIGLEAFMNNNIEGTIEANKLMTLGVRAFMDNNINRVAMNNLKIVPHGAFRNNKLQEVSIENATEVGVNAFVNNEIEHLNASSLVKVGKFGFNNNKLTEVNLLNVEEIGVNGFSNNELTSIQISKDVLFSENSFYKNPGAYNYMGYFPVYSTATEETNKVDNKAKIVINPTTDFVEDTKNELRKENQVYLYRTEQNKDLYGYAVAQDDEGNYYYCVSEYTTFTQGVFERKPIENTVYIVQHGKSKDLEDTESSLPVQKQIVSIDTEPQNYKIGYESDLVSKLIYHSNEMINEKELERTNKVTIKLLQAVVSNLEVENVVLTSSNVLEHIENTSNYQRIIDIFGKDFVDELFLRIKKDNREYAQATYLEYVDNELNYDGVEFSQSVIEPGKPVNEKIDISVVKYWNNDVESDRPSSIQVNLLRDSKIIETVELTSENDWKYVFRDLDKADEEGNEYIYTLQEKEVEGYITTLTGDSNTGFILTNTKEPTEPTEPTEPSEPTEPTEPTEPEEPTQEEPTEPEEPKQEEPTQEEPKQEDPKQEDPKQEDPKQEEPKQEEPTQEAPKQEESKQEESKQQYLPQTGEKRDFITLFSGVLLLGISLFYYKKKLV